MFYLVPFKGFWLIYGDCAAINIAHAALSFFKPFPRKCSTPSNGPSNAVAVMSWTAAFLQDKLRHLTLVSLWTNFLLIATQSTHTPTHRGHHQQLLLATWKTLINISPLVARLLSECHLPNTGPQKAFLAGTSRCQVEMINLQKDPPKPHQANYSVAMQLWCMSMSVPVFTHVWVEVWTEARLTMPEQLWRKKNTLRFLISHLSSIKLPIWCSF